MSAIPRQLGVVVPGIKGDKGDKGDRGEQGIQGIPGERGEKGDKGDKGDPGSSTGIPGPQGPQGPQGPAGPQGATGPAGPAGATGPQGPAGNDGPTGPAGPQGPQGPAGPTGATGPAGATGNTGSAGPGVPVGGAVGQQLFKSGSGDFATGWEWPDYRNLYTLPAAVVIPANTSTALLYASVSLSGGTFIARDELVIDVGITKSASVDVATYIWRLGTTGTASDAAIATRTNTANVTAPWSLRFVVESDTIIFRTRDVLFGGTYSALGTASITIPNISGTLILSLWISQAGTTTTGEIKSISVDRRR